jgi:hypothetical protein
LNRAVASTEVIDILEAAGVDTAAARAEAAEAVARAEKAEAALTLAKEESEAARTAAQDAADRAEREAARAAAAEDRASTSREEAARDVRYLEAENMSLMKKLRLMRKDMAAAKHTVASSPAPVSTITSTAAVMVSPTAAAPPPPRSVPRSALAPLSSSRGVNNNIESSSAVGSALRKSRVARVSEAAVSTPSDAHIGSLSPEELVAHARQSLAQPMLDLSGGGGDEADCKQQ